MRYYVEINGESSLDIQGLMIQSLPSISKPLIRSKQETIDGRDGDIITKLGYGAYDKTLKIGLWGNYDINEVIAFFNQEGTITFSNEPDKYYRFTILNREDYVSQLDKFRTATIMIHCQPFKYKLNEEAEEIENEYTTQEGTSLTFNNSLVAPMNIDLKGNTLQNGTPTPSSPIPVNVVSGDNDIIIRGKNLFDKDSGFDKGYYSITGSWVNEDVTACLGITPVKPNTTYTFSTNVNTQNKNVIYFDSAKTFIGRGTVKDFIKDYTFTTPINAHYVRLTFSAIGRPVITQNLIDSLDVQLEEGSTATTYEAYNGTTYNIDLPVENLFDKDNANIENGYIDTIGMVLITSQLNRLFYIPCKPNTTYTISRSIKTSTFRVATYDNTPFPSTTSSSLTYSISGLIKNNDAYSITITTGANAKYLIVHYGRLETDPNIEESLATIQVELGSKANSYTPYGTTPIELNKIGTYQDYFYKQDDKWYLHKEIGKVVLDGTTNSFTNRYTTNTNNYYRHVWENGSVKNQPGGTIANAYCNKLSPVSIGSTYGCNQGVSINDINHRIIMYINDIREMTIEQANQWLKTNNIIVYYLIDTPTNTEITYQPLINQLESIKNAMSKAGTTNVNQVNNDAPFIITASVLSGTDSITLTNEGNATSKPTLTITGSGVVGVYLENIQMFNISLGTNETIIIDTENMEAYYGSQLKNRQVTGDYSNFALQSGTNNLKFTGLVTNVEITNYNRWI